MVQHIADNGHDGFTYEEVNFQKKGRHQVKVFDGINIIEFVIGLNSSKGFIERLIALNENFGRYHRLSKLEYHLRPDSFEYLYKPDQTFA